MTSSLDIKRRESEALSFIRASIERRGFSPSFEELRQHLRLVSKSSVARIIDALEAQGKITRSAHRSRAIEIVSAGPEQYLPPDLRERLRAHAAKTGDTPLSIIIDAVTEHLDEAEPGVARHLQNEARAQ